MRRGAMPTLGMKQIVTAVNPKEYAEIVAYARKKKTSVYALLKKGLFEFMRRNP